MNRHTLDELQTWTREELIDAVQTLESEVALTQQHLGNASDECERAYSLLGSADQQIDMLTTTIAEMAHNGLGDWRGTLESALEHASHAWADLKRHGLVDETMPVWPPDVSNDVGTVAYHFAAVIKYVQRVYEAIWIICPGKESEGREE